MNEEAELMNHVVPEVGNSSASALHDVRRDQTRSADATPIRNCMRSRTDHG